MTYHIKELSNVKMLSSFIEFASSNEKFYLIRVQKELVL